MKKILYIHHAVGWGGAPKSMIGTINALDKTKFSPLVLLLRDSVVSEHLRVNNIPFLIADSFFYRKFYSYLVHSEAGYIKWYQLHRVLRVSISWVLSRYWFAKKTLNNINFDFDIVHLNSSVLTDWLAPCKAKGRVIIHIREPFRRGPVDPLYIYLRYQMKKYADEIIAISNDNARRVNLPEKTQVVYNYAISSFDEPSMASYKSKRFLYLGGGQRIKGFYTLVEALDYLNEDVKILFAGDYSLPNKSLKSKIKSVIGMGAQQRQFIMKMQNHPRANVLGMVDNVGKLIDQSCCVLSAFSKPHFSRVVIEANLRQKPVIGSDVSGMDEIIRHGTNGVIVSADNKLKLAEAINYIASNSETAKEMGVAGYQVAMQKFTPRNIKSIEAIYMDLSGI